MPGACALRLAHGWAGVWAWRNGDAVVRAIIVAMSTPVSPLPLPPSEGGTPSGVVAEAPHGLPAQAAHGAPGVFNPDETTHFQTRLPKAPVWFCSFLASNRREKRRLGDELAHIKGAWPLLMKERRGGQWTDEDRQRLRAMVRSASAVSPYLFIWAIPGSMALLPFLAWYLDRQRKRKRKAAG